MRGGKVNLDLADLFSDDLLNGEIEKGDSTLTVFLCSRESDERLQASPTDKQQQMSRRAAREMFHNEKFRFMIFHLFAAKKAPGNTRLTPRTVLTQPASATNSQKEQKKGCRAF